MKINNNRILIRYGELTLKGQNKKQFERILINNIQRSLKDLDVKLTKEYNRLYLEYINDEQLIIAKLEKIPGISSFSVAYPCVKELNVINELVLQVFQKNYQRGTFALNVKRSDKNFPLNSIEIARSVAAFLLSSVNDPNVKVKLKNPDFEITIEIGLNEA